MSIDAEYTYAILRAINCYPQCHYHRATMWEQHSLGLEVTSLDDGATSGSVECVNDFELLRDTFLDGDLPLEVGLNLAELGEHQLFRLNKLRWLWA